MSDEEMSGTKPVVQHEWLQNLVGEWDVTSEMSMPDGSSMTSTGTESVTSLGGLWAHCHGKGEMPNGEMMEYFSAIGYDVSFNEYRGCWYASVSSHLWKQTGVMSADGKTLTLNCTGPHMEKDGETAEYRDVHQLVDANTRTMTSMGQDENGEWCSFMVTTMKRKS